MFAKKQAVIIYERCKNCEVCEPQEKCPAYAIVKEDDEYYVGPSCQGCGYCRKFCPYNAIDLTS